MKLILPISLISLFLIMDTALAQSIQLKDTSEVSLPSTGITYYISTQKNGPPIEGYSPCGAAGAQFQVPIPSDTTLNVVDYYLVAANCATLSVYKTTDSDDSVKFTLKNHTTNLTATCGIYQYGEAGGLTCTSSPK